jgi:hypothetical protein
MSLLLDSAYISDNSTFSGSDLDININTGTVYRSLKLIQQNIALLQNTTLSIGTSANQNKLTIDSSGSYDRIIKLTSDATYKSGIQYLSTNSYYLLQSGTNLTFNYKAGDYTGLYSAISATELIRLTSDAKLGIGTASPSESIHVNGKISTTNIISSVGSSSYTQRSIPATTSLVNNVNLTDLNKKSKSGAELNNIRSITSVNNFINGVFYSIVYGGPSGSELYVAVGSSSNMPYNNIAYSSDGITWTVVNLSQIIPFQTRRSVVWAGSPINLFVAVSSSGTATHRIATSPDGITWTTRTGSGLIANTGFGQITTGTVSGNTVLVATMGTYMMRSTDGITWTSYNLSRSYTCVAWGNVSGGLFVAGRSSAPAVSHTSPDGITWTDRASTAQVMQSIVYGGTSGNECFVTTNGTNIFRSTNGINWTDQGATPQTVMRVSIWIGGTKNIFNFTRGEGNNSNGHYQSPDGITWTFVQPNFFSCNDLASNGTRVIACAGQTTSYGNRYTDTIETTTSWTTVTINGNVTFRTITYSPDLSMFVALSNGSENNKVAYSYDGINWNLSVSQPLTVTFLSVCYGGPSGGRLFVGVGAGVTGNCFMTSADGITWTQRSSPGGSGEDWAKVIWIDELQLFIASARAGSSLIATSPNGTTWTSRQSRTNGFQGIGMVWSPELKLIVVIASTSTSNTARLATSPDGITWTLRTTLNTAISWRSVDWSPELQLFVASSLNSTTIARSSDGINWSYGTLPSSQDWIQVMWIKELSVFLTINLSTTSATALNSAYSYDGINWNTLTMVVSDSVAFNNFREMVYSPELGMLLMVTAQSSGNRIYRNTFPIKNSIRSTILFNPAHIKYDSSGKLSLAGTTGLSSQTYQLELTADSAAKITSNSWTISSDERLKTNVVDADIDICYNNIKNLPLKRYKWRDNVYKPEQINNDYHKLGFIAQDYQLIFPKDVTKYYFKNDYYDIPDCLTINDTQILMSSIGAIKKIMNKLEPQIIYKPDILNIVFPILSSIGTSSNSTSPSFNIIKHSILIKRGVYSGYLLFTGNGDVLVDFNTDTLLTKACSYIVKISNTNIKSDLQLVVLSTESNYYNIRLFTKLDGGKYFIKYEIYV